MAADNRHRYGPCLYGQASSGPGVGTVDQPGEVCIKIGPDLPVALALFGVVAHHEPSPSPARATWTSLTRRLSATVR